jgi:hypothetical protein
VPAKAGRTGVRRYVCFGGRFGKHDGSIRSVVGMTRGAPSSSDGSNSGEGVRDGGGSNAGASTNAMFSVDKCISA